jgi:alkylated DNA nucleotide flippase Atl1
MDWIADARTAEELVSDVCFVIISVPMGKKKRYDSYGDIGKAQDLGNENKNQSQIIKHLRFKTRRMLSEGKTVQ